MKKIILASIGTIIAVIMGTVSLVSAPNPLLALNNSRGTSMMSGTHMHDKMEMFQQLASWLNMSPADLMMQLRAGKTLAQIMADKGVTKAQLHDKARAYVKTQLDPSVSSGDITQDQENTLLQIFDRLFERHADEVLTKQFTGMWSHHNGFRNPSSTVPSTP